MHDCPDCGLGHDAPIAEPVPVIPAEPPSTSDNDVRIAEVQAETVVQLAEIDAAAEESEDKQRIAELEGENRGLRETVAALTPPEPPPPAPVVVEPAEPVAEPTDPPPVTEAEQPRARQPKKGFF
jgi:hypothetical protein